MTRTKRKQKPIPYRPPSRIYAIYLQLVFLCCDPKEPGYDRYGGRGIQLCRRWDGIGGFWNFFDDIGGPPSARHTLRRRDKNKNFSSRNCFWAVNPGKRSIYDVLYFQSLVKRKAQQTR